MIVLSLHLSQALLLAVLMGSGDDVDARVDAAGRDVARLWSVVEECRQGADDDGLQRAAYRILEIDPGHAGAHEALSHHLYDGRWFESYTELSAYRRAEDRRMLAEHGLVRFGGDWVAQADIPFVRMGWARAPDGTWRSSSALEEHRRATELEAAGWQLQDLTWIHPDDFDKWREGLWKCGDDWLAEAEANARHAELDRWWQVPSEHFVTYGTLDRESVRWAGWWADQTHADLVRIFGLQPPERPVLVVVRDLEQYNALAGGDPASGRSQTEAGGHSSVHYAFFAEAWFDLARREYLGRGVSYWDASDPNLAPFGQHAIRHAAAQSFVEAIDPSWDAVSLVLETPGRAFQPQAFWGEKRIPRWLRYGAASYVERFFHDENVGDEGDPWWAREWALNNIRSGGELRDLPAIFAFQLDPGDAPGSGRMIHEAGLLVSFMLDGDCADVVRAHRAFKDALHANEGLEEAIASLQGALSANEEALRRYAEL